MAESAPGTSGGVASIEVRVPAQTDQLSGLRRIVREYIESAGGDRSTADDLELVASELATNVIEHTTSPTITISIERTPDEWVLEVSDVEGPFVLPEVAVLPATSDRSGRGLFVVRSLVDELEVVETPTSRALRCRRQLTR